jgi:hypothetical protein
VTGFSGPPGGTAGETVDWGTLDSCPPGVQHCGCRPALSAQTGPPRCPQIRSLHWRAHQRRLREADHPDTRDRWPEHVEARLTRAGRPGDINVGTANGTRSDRSITSAASSRTRAPRPAENAAAVRTVGWLKTQSTADMALATVTHSARRSTRRLPVPAAADAHGVTEPPA